jgi:hypothetical protein
MCPDVPLLYIEQTVRTIRTRFIDISWGFATVNVIEILSKTC